jgi:hypothetical protein
MLRASHKQTEAEDRLNEAFKTVDKPTVVLVVKYYARGGAGRPNPEAAMARASVD